MTEPDTVSAATAVVQETLGAVEDVCRRHGISALEEFLESCRAFAREKTLNIAVLGRFKAGKSSFLNHLFRRPLLPVGVVPVTSVVTEIEWGPGERAEILFADGRRDQVPVERIGDFISESENPENRKQVARVRVELPSMARYRGIRFVDTPGLDSVFEYNTDVSLDWLPNVGLALVAVGVDPPLSQHDIHLIRDLSRYTPNISLLLTKVDVLEEEERVQVREFVQKQLARYWNHPVPVFPYSIRPGFERLREELDDTLLSQVHAETGRQRSAVLMHKLDSLLSECTGYLDVALKAAEVADSEREELRHKILGEKESLDDTRLALKLIVRHAAGSTRSTFENLLREDDPDPAKATGRAGPRVPLVDAEPADRNRAFRRLDTGRFGHRNGGALQEASRRIRRAWPQGRPAASESLQDFRNRLSDRMLETLGVPLRTTEMELHAEDPKSPDVRVGKIFDHNWELLSWLIPMALVRGAVLRHYHRKVEDLVFTNLSRLASQWEGIANASLLALEKESSRRLDGLVATIEKLIASAGKQAPQIREDIESLMDLRRRLLP